MEHNILVLDLDREYLTYWHLAFTLGAKVRSIFVAKHGRHLTLPDMELAHNELQDLYGYSGADFKPPVSITNLGTMTEKHFLTGKQ